MIRAPRPSPNFLHPPSSRPATCANVLPTELAGLREISVKTNTNHAGLDAFCIHSISISTKDLTCTDVVVKLR